MRLLQYPYYAFIDKMPSDLKCKSSYIQTVCNQLHVALEYINCMLHPILFPTLIYFKHCIFIPVKYASTFISFDSFRLLPQNINDLNNTLILANLS